MTEEQREVPDEAGSGGPVRFGDFRFDPQTLELFGPEGPVDLAPTPARVLRILVESAGQVVPRNALWSQVWPRDRYDLDQKLNFAIHHLRKALGDEATSPRFVQTLPRRGYRFVAEVRPIEARVRAPGWRMRLVASLVFLVLGASVGGLISGGTPLDIGPRGESAGAEALRMAQYLLERGHQGDGELAEEYLWEALGADRELTDAWVFLGQLHEDRGDRAAAEYFLSQALQARPDLAEAHQVLARYAIEDGAWDRAGDHLNRAVRAGDAETGAHRALAHYAVMVGDREEALRQLEHVRRVDPGASIDAGDAGWLYYWSGEPERAIEACREQERLSGSSPLSRACLFSAYVASGDEAGAATVARTELDAGASVVLDEGAPDGDVIERFLTWRWSALSEFEGAHYAKARVAAFRADWPAVIGELEAATESEERGVRYVLAEPLFSPLHSDRRFVRLVERVGLPRHAATQSP